MAKKAKTQKTRKRKETEPLVSLGRPPVTELTLSKVLQKEPEVLRRLAHRTVDLLADMGDHAALAGSAEGHLHYIVDEVVLEYVNELIREARNPGKEVPRG